MSKSVALATAILLLSFWSIWDVASAIEVRKTFDPEWDRGPHYGVDLGSGCTYELEFSKTLSGNAIDAIANGSCPSYLENLPSVIDAILNAAARDGIELGDYRSLFLGEIRDLRWQQRFVDCYIAHFGLDDRRGPVDTPGWAFIDKCGVFQELANSFAKHGIELHLDSIEKGSAVDLSKSEWRGVPDIRFPPKPTSIITD